HPNIARVLDGGETPGGRPYFVMDLVKGLPITEFCDQNQFTPRERLELFLHVCQAVQHAHQKGIIHRDLKPSNVLVTLHDGRALVKVIDFGIAKAVGQQLTDKTLFTGFAQMVGTPLYMSPEQAALSNVDVDTRSDIYSLGVLLYELLTGTTPFDQERLRAVGYDEMRRIIREEEPPRPSTRLSTLGPAAVTVSTQRQSDPKRLSQLFRGELDWIVMKCLEKDRDRRYESASAFAADVQRYLADEPVQACPPSAWYRFHKFARRNKTALGLATTGGLFGVLGVAGLTVSTVVIGRREQETKKALEDLQEAVKRDRKNFYDYAFDLARRDWLANNIEQARRGLQNCPDELRDRDWYSLHHACHAELLRINQRAWRLQFSPDGKSLGIVPWYANIEPITLWDVATGQKRGICTTDGRVSAFAFRRDGKELVWATDGYMSHSITILGVKGTPPGFEVTV